MIKTNVRNDWTSEANNNSSDGQEMVTVESSDRFDSMIYFHLLCYLVSCYNYRHTMK